MPAFSGPNQRLWEDLNQLRQAAGAAVTIENAVVNVIAVTEVSVGLESIEHTATEQQLASLGNPKRLGYDVADYFFHACGGIGIALPNGEGGESHRFELFTSVEAARSAAARCDRNVPQHRPFLVYGLFLLETIYPRPT